MVCVFEIVKEKLRRVGKQSVYIKLTFYSFLTNKCPVVFFMWRLGKYVFADGNFAGGKARKFALQVFIHHRIPTRAPRAYLYI